MGDREIAIKIHIMPQYAKWLAKGGPPLLIFGVAVFVRLPYLLFWDLFFNSDTAVLGLMARHFIRGDFSVYYWGEAYYGALDPLLLAPLFKIFGATPAVCQWIPFVFSLLILWIYYRYLCGILDTRSAHVSTLILALAPPAFFQITHSVYNYTFILFFGIIHLSLFSRFLQGNRRKTFLLVCGFVMGFCWYYFRLIIVFWTAIILTWIAIRKSPDDWLKIREKMAAIRFSRFWNDLILLRRVPLPKLLKRCLVFINLYNLANFSVACFLWIRGNWFWTIGRLRVKLYLWPIFKSSVMLVILVCAVVHYRKVMAPLRRLWADLGTRIFVLGFLVGYSPALYGYVTGISPSSPGGLVALPKIAKNLSVAIPTMIAWMAGASRIPVLQGLSIAAVISAFVFLGRLFWIQTRARFCEGTAVKPFYSILALCLATGGLGIAGTNLGDANTLRFFAPLFFCLPVGLALGLKEIEKKSRILGWAILLVFLGNALLANILVWQNHRSPSRYELIAQDLAKEKIKGGYADYWTAYYLSFLTQEKIILAPTSGKERYLPYLKFVQSLDEVVLLGESVPPDQNKIQIKGIEYDVLKRDVWENLPVAILRKTGSTT
jgi:hypothetical protein